MGYDEESEFPDLSAVANCSIFEGFPQSQNFTCSVSTTFSLNLPVIFLQAPARFVFELLGEGRADYVADFLALYRALDNSTVTESDKDKFLLEMLKLLLNQTLTNPPQYVSHGTDHSVRYATG